MSKIISIATALPEHRHEQSKILGFMQKAYAMDETEARKLKFMYDQSGIDARYSVLPDYGCTGGRRWEFYPATENMEPFPDIEARMKCYNNAAPELSIKAIEGCVNGQRKEVTHLITVSCTGMTAPGLEMQIMEEMELSPNIQKTSINFMGCYAAIHALKLADAICNNDKKAKVLIVCTELCTLHFQKKNTLDNITSSLLFGDGAAAVLVVADEDKAFGLKMKSFYSEVSKDGKDDMRWELSSTGFLMTLSGKVPGLVEKVFNEVAEHALNRAGLKKENISHWCIHPGGKKILHGVQKAAGLTQEDLKYSYEVLKQYGNMSSPTILFVLKKIFDEVHVTRQKANILGAAFGPGLTTETFILTNA
jgi:predicted naringenin-chalcone synthase